MRIFLILPMLLLTMSAAASSKWQYVVESNKKDMYFIDSNSYQKSGDSITFWTLTNYNERNEFGDLSDKSQNTINCRTREIILRYMMNYDDRDNKGKMTSSFAVKDSWKPIAPDTVNWSLMRHVCK